MRSLHRTGREWTAVTLAAYERPWLAVTTSHLPDPADIPARDDGGAYAEDGFAFQHDCIARFAIEMLRDNSVLEIVCETHEDALVRFGDGSVELVSCKARDPGQPYTLESLLSSGGVRHLFESWIHTGQQCRTHLMAEAALSKSGEVRDLVDACHARDGERLGAWATRIASRLDTDEDTARRFLEGFRMTGPEALGPRARCGEINAVRLRGWLRDSHLDEALDLRCYSLLRDKVAQCCRAAVDDPLGPSSLLDASREPAKSAQRARIACRAIDREKATAAMIDIGQGRALLTGDPSELDHSRLTLKLERGEVPPQVIAAARRLRASWYEYESALAIRAPGVEAALTDVRARVMLAVADAMSTVDMAEPYGHRMYSALRAGVRTSSLGPLSVLGVSDELLLGLVFQATDECELFWSSTFDVGAQLG